MVQRLSARRLFECSHLEARRLLCGVHAVGDLGTYPATDPAPALRNGSGESIDQLNVPAFSSRPGATRKLYIDFNGHNSIDNWSGWWEVGGYTAGPTQAYDIDDNQLNYSYAERQNIEKIWKGVAEKFSPFDLDVTTVKPSALSPGKTAIVIVGGDGSWYGGGGGVAQVGGFNEGFFDGNSGNYGFVWANPNDPNYMADAVAHEAGHMFNLYHHSFSPIATNEYAPGFVMGSGGRWASTVANGTTATTRDGETVSVARSSQDDLGVLVTANGFGYRVDDFGNTLATATTLALSSVSGVFTGSTEGVNEQANDVDLVRIVHSGGSLEVEVLAAERRAMLDPQLGLVNSAGSFIESSATDDGLDGLGEKISINSLPAGTYYLRVSSEGGYGNIGQWRLNVRAGTGSTTPNNTMGSALTIGLHGDTGQTGVSLGFGGNAIIPESVQASDLYDFFRVRLPVNVRSFFAQISGMTTSMELQVIKDANGNQLTDAGELLFSSVGGTGTQGINLTNDLAAGEVLYIRTRNLGGGNSNYTLRLASDIGLATLPPTVANSFFDPPKFHGGVTIYDSIMPAAGDTVDYYRLKPEFDGQLSAFVFETGGDVRISFGNDLNANGVLDAGEFLVSSANTNDFIDLIPVTANANILIRVTGSVEANYNVFAMMDYPTAGNTTGTLTGGYQLPVGNTGTFQEYLGYAGDFFDTFKFNPIAGVFHAKLTMTEPQPAHRLQIIQDSNTNGIVDPGEIVADGFGELTYNITTFANYYMRVQTQLVGEFGTIGNYRLAWWAGNSVEPPAAAPTPITPTTGNSTLNGYLGFNPTEAALTDTEDRYQFTLGARTRFDVSLNNAAFGLQILRSVGGGTQRIVGIGTNEGTISALSANLDPGTYIVRAYLPVGERETRVLGGDYTMSYKTAAITDNSPPLVSSSGFQYEVKSTGVYFVMDQDVAGSIDLADASVIGLDNGFIFPLRRTHYDAATNTVGFDFVAPVLPDGRYRATLAAGSLKDLSNNPTTSAYTFDFFVFGSDFNRDGTVNFSDLVRLAQNYNKPAGAVFSEGDADYDRDVDFADLVLLAQRYNTSLPGLSMQVASPTAERVRSRVADDALGIAAATGQTERSPLISELFGTTPSDLIEFAAIGRAERSGSQAAKAVSGKPRSL